MELLRNTISKLIEMGSVYAYMCFSYLKIGSEVECHRTGVVRLFCPQPRIVNHVVLAKEIVPVPTQHLSKSSQIYIILLKTIYGNIWSFIFSRTKLNCWIQKLPA
jgi:hypothetical protein